MTRDAYTEAMKLAGAGATVVLNRPDMLKIWHTPVGQLPDDARQALCSDSEAERTLFNVEYAAFAPA